MALPALRIPSLRQGLLMACAGVGALVLFSTLSLVLFPIVFGLGVVMAWILGLLLMVWGGIEVLAALERWLERDPRFQR
ncbi:MAG: glypican [Cyanobium sp.]